MELELLDSYILYITKGNGPQEVRFVSIKLDKEIEEKVGV